MKTVFKFISPGTIPFTICLLLIVFILLYRTLNLPSPEQLNILIEKWFNYYGFWLLFFAAFLEGLFVIGMYFPGSLAIALAVYSLGKTPLDLFYIGSISYTAFLIANLLNYNLGKYGYYRFLLFIGKSDLVDKMKIYMTKHGDRAFLFTGFFPNFIAITSVCAGISNMNFLKTFILQASSLLFWVTVWTIVGSLIIKNVNLRDNNQTLYILAAVFSWGVYLVIRDNVKRKRK